MTRIVGNHGVIHHFSLGPESRRATWAVYNRPDMTTPAELGAWLSQFGRAPVVLALRSYDKPYDSIEAAIADLRAKGEDTLSHEEVVLDFTSKAALVSLRDQLDELIKVYEAEGL